MPAFTAIDLSPQQYRQRMTAHASRFPLPAIGQYARELMLHGHLDALTTFERTPFLRIGELAALANLPASTVRHYTALGLILHYRMNGKHYYDEHSFGTLINVQDWCALGLTLGEIDDKILNEQVAGKALLTALGDHVAAAGLDSEGRHLASPLPDPQSVEALMRDPVRRQALLNDSRFTALKAQQADMLAAAKLELEAKRQEIDNQLARIEELQRKGR